MNNPVNTTFAYPCLKCSHSEVIDFANPPATCSKCGEPLPKLELPVQTTLPTTEITSNPQIDSSEGEISSESSEG
jgi:hypothetical protein